MSGPGGYLAAATADFFEDAMNANNEEKLRQLVQLRGQRDRLLSLSDEEKILEEAVTQLDLPLGRARGILLAAADSESIEIESDLERVSGAMISALAGASRTISYDDFEAVVKFHAARTQSSTEDSRKAVKKLAERETVAPRRSGALFSTRWFRRIK